MILQAMELRMVRPPGFGPGLEAWGACGEPTSRLRLRPGYPPRCRGSGPRRSGGLGPHALLIRPFRPHLRTTVISHKTIRCPHPSCPCESRLRYCNASEYRNNFLPACTGALTAVEVSDLGFYEVLSFLRLRRQSFPLSDVRDNLVDHRSGDGCPVGEFQSPESSSSSSTSHDL